MKNKLKFLSIFIASFIFVYHTDAQDRNVYWLHGFNGVTSHWRRYADKFQSDREMASSRIFYATNGSINNITNGINISSHPQNIGIGHSLGGVICRNFEVTGGDEVGGVITVHSPNQGASVAKAVNDGRAEEFLTHISTTVATALDEIRDHMAFELNVVDIVIGLWNGVATFIPDLFSILGVDVNISLIEGEFIPSNEEIEAQISSSFDQIYDPALQDIFNDLDPTNGFMANMNNFPSAMPRIEVHGYEKDKELFRMGCSDDLRVWNSPLADEDPIDDNCFLGELDDARSTFNKVQAWLNTKGALTIAQNPFRVKAASRLFDAAGKVKDAKDLIKTGIELGWEDLIGVQYIPQTTSYTQTTEACQTLLDQLYQQETALTSNGQNEGDNAAQLALIFNQINDLLNDPDCTETVQSTFYVPVDNSEAPHDGLILEAEQVTGASGVPTYQNEEVNHIEVLNHPEMWDNFNDIFDRTDFFNTPPR